MHHKDPFIQKAFAVIFSVMAIVSICGVAYQHEKATRPMTRMTCKTVEVQKPEGDWVCLIWDEKRPTEQDFIR